MHATQRSMVTRARSQGQRCRITGPGSAPSSPPSAALLLQAMKAVLLIAAYSMFLPGARCTGDSAHPDVSLVDPHAPGLDVWILSGQSNMQGDNMRDWQPMPECAEPWPGSIYSFPRGNDTWLPEWIPALPNTCFFASFLRQDPHSVGPEMAFAKTLIRAGASRRVGFVPVTYGGSSLYLDWHLPQGLLGMLMSQVRLAMHAAGPGAVLRGMLWVQGEGDATLRAGQAHAAAYGENLRILVDTVRTRLADLHPQLPVIIGVQATTDRDRVLPHIGLVRRHQQELRMPSLLKVDMEGLEMLPDNFTEMYGPNIGVQRLHVTKRGMCEFGEALAQTYLNSRDALALAEAAAVAERDGASGTLEER